MKSPLLRKSSYVRRRKCEIWDDESEDLSSFFVAIGNCDMERIFQKGIDKSEKVGYTITVIVVIVQLRGGETICLL